MKPVIEFEHVSKRYRLGMTRTSLPAATLQWAKSLLTHTSANPKSDEYFWALNDVSFTLNRGESLALVGSNGAGKTTTLKLLAKITRPTSGKININGTLSALIELGAGFHPDLSGRENIFLNGTILGLKKADIQRKFDEIVAFAELERFIDTPVKRYSSGMAVRLGFAVASSVEPDILLVDEVLAVGDTAFRMKCLERIRALLNGGASLIFVSHNTGLVKAICKKSLYVERGKALYYGETEEAIELYNQALNENRKQRLKASGLAPDETKGHLEIGDVQLLGPDGASSPSYQANQPLDVICNYVAYEAVDEMDVVVRVIRTDGISCAVLYSERDGSRFRIAKGRGRLMVRLDPLQLFPGTYYIVVTLKSPDKAITFDMGRSEWFDVKDESGGHLDLDGVFEPNRQWQHEEIA
jgi:lipopolysaccharide transport system ATP-binding protein